VNGKPNPLVAPAAQDCALLLVDLQIGAVATIRTIEPERLRSHVIALATVAQMHAMPAILTAGRKPGVGGVFMPELRAMLPSAPYAERSHAAAFDDLHVREALLAAQRKTLIVAGVATDIGVCFAALGALQAGYEVWVVVDACGAVDAAAEEAARLRMAREGAIITGWASLAVGLMGDFEGPHGLPTMALIAARAPVGFAPF
jgi:nicotinamidase-related amidase